MPALQDFGEILSKFPRYLCLPAHFFQIRHFCVRWPKFRQVGNADLVAQEVGAAKIADLAQVVGVVAGLV
jgi:hypothetical protein